MSQDWEVGVSILARAEARALLRKRRFNPFVVSLSNHDRIKSITIN